MTNRSVAIVTCVVLSLSENNDRLHTRKLNKTYAITFERWERGMLVSLVAMVWQKRVVTIDENLFPTKSDVSATN